MYLLIILLLLIGGIYLASKGLQKKRKPVLFAGIFILVATAVFFWFLGFWGEYLWFESLGFNERFIKVFFTRAAFSIGGALLALLVISLLTSSISPGMKIVRKSAMVLGLLLGGSWGYSSWDILLQFLNRISVGTADPVFQRDIGFYFFVLPFLDLIYSFFLMTGVIALLVIIASYFMRIKENRIVFDPGKGEDALEKESSNRFFISAGFILLTLAFGRFLNRYQLMYSTHGIVNGPGWTDIHIRLPAYTVIIIITALTGLIFIIPALRTPAMNQFKKIFSRFDPGVLSFFSSTCAAVFILWVIGLSVLPGLFQWLRVEPNEITFEKPYINHNIDFTRRAFKLDTVEEKEFPASGIFHRDLVEENRDLFSNIRLWDHRALEDVYRQFQEIRLYYRFTDVDIDRYHVGGDYRQVMVSARELDPSNLPVESKTFVNQRFKYTHGYGITLTGVNEFTSEGLPDLLIRDIPPKWDFPGLEINSPQIYYGELTDYPVIVNSEEKELDYPKGEENVYTRYRGKGGVNIGSLGLKFLFGWKFDGTRLFFSGYPKEDSRILFNRQINTRVKKIAPFLRFDEDPYVVLAEGKLYWIIDGYTSSEKYPYSESFTSSRFNIPSMNTNYSPARSFFSGSNSMRHLRGINYIRNSVKAVIDAYEGTVDFYIFEPDDPLVNVWKNIFPQLFKNKDELSESLIKHIRYPVDMLKVQGRVYSKYHMTDPTVFYNQEDLWVTATEKYYNSVQEVEPYYIMWEPPGMNRVEFVLIHPFTPKNRQVLIGWIAGMCDGDNYGRLLAYKFPKEKRVLGTQQVETKIDQDSFLSGQLTLWDQRGSQVIRGNVLVIPIGDTLLYVEPIYLKAETAAYPELRKVVLMHNDNLSYGDTFDEALEGLLGEGDESAPVKRKADLTGEENIGELIKEINEAFENYLRDMGQKQFDSASDELETMRRILNRLMENNADQ
ncbi:MAG: UPF0182 family protein [Deltaproteobacteria bacterium]|nr:UPF0182 family protein [Deltaproteobacteria bacterium]